MKLKRIVIGLLALTMSVNSLCISAFANDNLDQNVPDFISGMIEIEDMGYIVTKHDLYDINNNIVAYCLDFENAYMIYDCNGDVIEYCETSESPLSGIEEDVYYSGPFSYYTLNNGVYENILSGEQVSSSDFLYECIEFNELSSLDLSMTEADTAAVFSANNVRVTTTQDGEYKKVKQALVNKPRCFDYYTEGYCGCVAVTTLLFYYYDNINSGILKSNYANNPRLLYNYLYNFIPYYASYDDIRNNLENQFPNISNSYPSSVISYDGSMDTNADAQYTWGGYKYLLTSQGIPAILLLQGHPSYRDHWVVTYGVIAYYDTNNTLKVRQYVVNNGFGKNDVKISCKYVDGYIYLD